MALKATTCTLALLGGAEALLSTQCRDAVNALFTTVPNPNGFVNAQAPECTFPSHSVLGLTRKTADADGSLFTTRAEAEGVCPALMAEQATNMCSGVCQTAIGAAQVACAGQGPVTDDLANLAQNGAAATNMDLTWWSHWFNIMNQVDTLCSNVCLQYYCANKDKAGFETLAPACSTTTTTVTQTTTITETVTVVDEPAVAPVTPTTAMATVAPAVTAPVVVAAPVGSMPANLAAAQAVGNQEVVRAAALVTDKAAVASPATVASPVSTVGSTDLTAGSTDLTAGLLNAYSGVLSIHPGYIVGAVGCVAAAVILFVGNRPSVEEFGEVSTTAE